MRLGMTDFECMVIASPVPVEFGSEPLTLMEPLERLAPNLARIVVVTSEAETEAIRRARELEVHEILLRPFGPAQLRDAVEQCLRRQASLSCADLVPVARPANPRLGG